MDVHICRVQVSTVSIIPFQSSFIPTSLVSNCFLRSVTLLLTCQDALTMKNRHFRPLNNLINLFVLQTLSQKYVFLILAPVYNLAALLENTLHISFLLAFLIYLSVSIEMHLHFFTRFKHTEELFIILTYKLFCQTCYWLLCFQT